ncbi:MAG: ABC transporter permease [Flavobacteriaceae bacterium]|nr:ABC transporter permease [Flavobacteriaceae bacterium]
MIKNYLKTSWRNIVKNKLFSAINVVGLSIGLCASMVIGAIVYYDFSFDTFHKDKDHIYRVVTVFQSKEGESSNRGVPIPLMRTFQEGISGVELAAPFMNTYFYKIENREDNLKFKNEENAIFADNNYFKLFQYQWLGGNSDVALSKPAQVVLEEKQAQKYFPGKKSNDIIGQTLIYNDSVPVEVVGVVAGFKEKSDLKFTQFVSLSSAGMFGRNDIATDDGWGNTNSADQLFFKTRDKESIQHIQTRLYALAEEHEDTSPWGMDNKRSFVLQPLSDLHFGELFGNYPFDNSDHQGNLKVLKGLGLVALFLLLLGCVNFINLNSAQALTRAREIGIRKTLGSSKKQVVRQFLTETFILTSIAAVVSFILAPLLLRQFTNFLPADVDLSVLYTWKGAMGVLMMIILISLLSGFYPAFVLSGFRPVSVLKGQFISGNKGVRLRKSLTVIQFVVAQVFIIATLLIAKQLHYVMNKDMGIKTNAVAYIYTPWDNNTASQKASFFTKTATINGLSNISLGGNPPASNSMTSTMLTYFKGENEMHLATELLRGDLTYLKTYGIPLLAGRDRLNDSIEEYVVNEKFARALGFEDPTQIVGTFVKRDTLKIPIVGVMQDFNQRSLRSAIKPMALRGTSGRSKWNSFGTIHFDLTKNTNLWPQIIDQIKVAWSTVYPEEDFKINFMDDMVQGFYTQERSTVQLLKWATGLAIVISCLGLLGLVVYTTERKVKEIGIRKVLGSNFVQLNVLLSREFLMLLGIAFIIASPVSWYLVHQWMQEYAYKTAMSWWVFLLSGLGMVLVSLLVIGVRIYKSAHTNPVEALRNE